MASETRWRRRKRIVITVVRMEDGRYCAGDTIWAYGTGRTFRAALRDYALSVESFIATTEGYVGPGVAEQRARYLDVMEARTALGTEGEVTQ